jgi:hypothetical protein
MRRVIIESPYSGNVERNVRFLQDCILDCLSRGESPYASHQMLTLALKDADPEQRRLGIEAGFAWRPAAEATVAYYQLGVSDGMVMGCYHAQSIGQPVFYRKLAHWPVEL